MSFTEFDHDLPNGSTIKLFSGGYIDLLQPKISDIQLRDIAHALSLVCRFGGHIPTHYSVAEHSLNVSAQLWRTHHDRQLAAAGLLHDATEAYIGDMVRPLKRSGRCDGYRDIEDALALVIEAAFALPMDSLSDPRVKACDNEILSWEMAMVRDSRVRIAPAPADVEAAFLNMAAWVGL